MISQEQMVQEIVQLTQRRFADWLHLNNEPNGNVIARSCWFWAANVASYLCKHDCHAIVQAGSAGWERVPPHLDDEISPNYFQYVWDGSITPNLMPEMHVWAVIVQPLPVIVDFTTRYVVQNCREDTGLPWVGKAPPDYLWTPAAEMRDCYYEANPKATAFAHSMLRKVPAHFWK